MALHSSSFLQDSRFRPEQFQKQTQFSLSNGTTVHIVAAGIISFEPAKQKDCKSILLSSGVHGNETAPIEICERLVENLLKENIVSKHRVMFIFGNLAAMNIQERFVEENLNRLFNDCTSVDNLEQRRAQEIKSAVKCFFEADKLAPETHRESLRCHYDLHTAIRESKNEKFAVYPFLHGEDYNKQQLQFLSACAVNTILLSQSPTSTFSYYTSKVYQAHGFTVELGKVKPFGENDMSKFNDVDKMLNELITQTELKLPEYDDCPLNVYDVNQVINKHSEQFVLNFADDMPNFTCFVKGALLATDGSREYRAEVEGEAIVFPNANVALGQRAILTVVPCEL
jgi:succinylglutamate desuccinylase